jgi:hypothetical protein
VVNEVLDVVAAGVAGRVGDEHLDADQAGRREGCDALGAAGSGAASPKVHSYVSAPVASVTVAVNACASPTTDGPACVTLDRERARRRRREDGPARQRRKRLPASVRLFRRERRLPLGRQRIADEIRDAAPRQHDLVGRAGLEILVGSKFRTLIRTPYFPGSGCPPTGRTMKLAPLTVASSILSEKVSPIATWWDGGRAVGGDDRVDHRRLAVGLGLVDGDHPAAKGD